MGFFNAFKILDSSQEKTSSEDPQQEAAHKESLDDDGSWLPETEGQLAVDVYQTEHDLIISSTIAGVDMKSLDIQIENDIITIRGRRERPEEVPLENYFCQECYFGPFSRSVVLPVEAYAAQAEATMQNGILMIRIPKVEQTQPKKLQIKMNK